MHKRSLLKSIRGAYRSAHLRYCVLGAPLRKVVVQFFPDVRARYRTTRYKV